MIKIWKDDSLIDIISKINDLKEKKITLNIAFWNPILHDYLSLKILKNKFKNRDIIIITSDLTSRSIWKKLGIKYSIINDDSFYKSENILKHNFSFFEYFKFLLKKYYNELKDFIFLNKKLNSLKKYSTINKSNKSWLWLFLFTFLISVFIFFFLFYFAVNKTYIYITPEIEVKTRSENLIFKEFKESDYIDTNRFINLKEIDKIVQLELPFTTSWVKEESLKKSRWKAILYNKYPEEVSLKPKTRFVTEDWILFESENWLKVPKAILWSDNKIIPWELQIDLISQAKDINWKIIWTNWNIKKWLNLSLPWLGDEQDKMYAISETDFSGWEDSSSMILTDLDLENAKKIMETSLKKQALEDVKDELKSENKKNNVTYDILSVDDSIEYSSLDIKEIWDIKVWAEINDFKLSGSIKIKVYIYNKQSVINSIRDVIDSHTIKESERILYINDDSIRFSLVLYKNKRPFEMKSTVELEYFLTQNFLSENNAFVERLKSGILWMDKDEALKVLLNNPKISAVEIENKPFFVKNISNIMDNIKIKVVED